MWPHLQQLEQDQGIERTKCGNQEPRRTVENAQRSGTGEFGLEGVISSVSAWNSSGHGFERSERWLESVPEAKQSRKWILRHALLVHWTKWARPVY